MSIKYIGFGQCSKSYLYILFAFILKILDDNFLSFTAISPQIKSNIFGISPVLANHVIIQNFYKYVSCIIGGIIFKFIIKKNTKKRRKSMKSNKNKINFNISQIPILIHYKSDLINKPILEMAIVSIIYVLHYEFLDILYTFKIDNLCFWSLEIIFMIIFIKKYFIIKFYNYQECSLMFMLISVCILLIIFSAFPVMDGNSDSKISYNILEILVDKNYFVFILIIIIINSFEIFISYARVRAKVLFDFKYISPYTLLIVIGIFGLFVTMIELIFGTKYKCEEPFYKFCNVESDEVKYFDNLIIYFRKFKEKEAKEFYLEIFLLLPIFMIINVFELICEFLIIIHLNPIFVLIQNNFAYGISYLLFMIIPNYNNDNKINFLPQFFIIETAEITSIICYMIYLQIIELRFCGLDTYLDRNLLLLSNEESINSINDIDDEDVDSSSEYSLYKKETIYV